MTFIFELGGVSVVILVVAVAWCCCRIASESTPIVQTHPDVLKRLEAAARWNSTHQRRRA